MRHSRPVGLSGALASVRSPLGHVRAVTFLAVPFEQHLAARGLVAIDGAEDLLGPVWRAQPLQRLLDAMQSADVHGSCGSARAGGSGRPMALISGTMAPTPSASPTLRASGCDTEPLYCTQSNFQMFHTYG